MAERVMTQRVSKGSSAEENSDSSLTLRVVINQERLTHHTGNQHHAASDDLRSRLLALGGDDWLFAEARFENHVLRGPSLVAVEQPEHPTSVSRSDEVRSLCRSASRRGRLTFHADDSSGVHNAGVAPEALFDQFSRVNSRLSAGFQKLHRFGGKFHFDQSAISGS